MKQNRLDELEDLSNLGNRVLTLFLPALAMAATSVQFGSWRMGLFSTIVAAATAIALQPALSRWLPGRQSALSLPAPGPNPRIRGGE